MSYSVLTKCAQGNMIAQMSIENINQLGNTLRTQRREELLAFIPREGFNELSFEGSTTNVNGLNWTSIQNILPIIIETMITKHPNEELIDFRNLLPIFLSYETFTKTDFTSYQFFFQDGKGSYQRIIIKVIMNGPDSFNIQYGHMKGTFVLAPTMIIYRNSKFNFFRCSIRDEIRYMPANLSKKDAMAFMSGVMDGTMAFDGYEEKERIAYRADPLPAISATNILPSPSALFSNSAFLPSPGAPTPNQIPTNVPTNRKI